MGLFSTPEEKQVKENEKMQEFIQQYDLAELTQQDYKLLKQILSTMNVASMNSSLAAFGNAETRAQLMYSQAMVNQNWMMIKQLSRISAQLEKLANK